MVTAEHEIRWLRLHEEEQQAAAVEADRLTRDLLSIYKCDFIVVDLPPQFSYAFLDGDWRNNNGTCRPMRYRLDRGYKGSIAISLSRLRELHKRALS